MRGGGGAITFLFSLHEVRKRKYLVMKNINIHVLLIPGGVSTELLPYSSSTYHISRLFLEFIRKYISNCFLVEEGLPSHVNNVLEGMFEEAAWPSG